MGRKTMGKERRVNASIRVEPWKKKLIEEMHGSFQAWLDLRLNEELGSPHTAVVVRKKAKPKKEEISADDF